MKIHKIGNDYALELSRKHNNNAHNQIQIWGERSVDENNTECTQAPVQVRTQKEEDIPKKGKKKKQIQTT